MTSTDIIALVVTIIGVASFAVVVTILFRNYIKSAIKEINLGQRDIEIVDLVIYEADPGVIAKKKATEVGKSIVYYTFLAILIPLFGLSLYSRIKNNVTQFGDQYVMVVASGSMSMKNEANTYLNEHHLNNQFNTYDIITLSKVSSQYALRLYDVVAYRNDKGVNVIHRIISIEESEGETRYITRGDSNAASDSYKPRYSDIIGRYTNKRLPGIGIFIMFFQSYAGIVTVVSVIYCSFMISYFNKKLDKAMEDRKEMLAKAFDMSTLGFNDPEKMRDSHAHYIYFKDYAYYFDSTGFVDKREMNEQEKEQYSVNEDPVKVEEEKQSQE